MNIKKLVISLMLFFLFTKITAAQGVNKSIENVKQRLPVDSLIRFQHLWTSPYQVDPEYPHHLVNVEGKNLFIMNKTAWAFFAMKDPEAFLETAKSQGITVIRVALEGTPYFSELGYDMWPWGGTRLNPDFKTLNENYWSKVEQRVRLAGEMGIGIDLVLYFTLHKTTLSVEEQKPYWHYILQRLGRFSNILTWEIMNEYSGQEAFQNAAGNFFHKNDPYRRPVCSSDGTTDNALWPGKTWMDLAVVHTCTGSTEKHHLLWWYLSVARNTRQYAKPAFNNESGREVRHKNDDAVHRRKQGWLWNAAGCFWTWHSFEGCEGIDDNSYRGPGQEYLKNMSVFFQSIPFWKMVPNYTLCQIKNPDLIATTLAQPDGSITVTYCCSPKTGTEVNNKKASLRLPDGLYIVSFISPVSLEKIQESTLESKSLGNVSEIELPGFVDDIIIKIEKIRTGKKTIIKGTE